MTSAGIPVVGADVDGEEWLTSRNMFSIFGYEDYTKVQTTYGTIFKQLGATTFGGIGYGIEPSSADVVKSAAAASAQLAGLKVGYVDTQVPLGSTNMAPIALAMKSAGVDGIFPGVTTQSSFALVNALRQEGVNLKVGLMPTGYGGDLTGGGQGAQQAAQGLYFTAGYEPVEMNTPATQTLPERPEDLRRLELRPHPERVPGLPVHRRLRHRPQSGRPQPDPLLVHQHHAGYHQLRRRRPVGRPHHLLRYGHPRHHGRGRQLHLAHPILRHHIPPGPQHDPDMRPERAGQNGMSPRPHALPRPRDGRSLHLRSSSAR